MSHETRTAELLVRWWNFTDAGVWGKAQAAKHLQQQTVHADKDDLDDELGLISLLSAPLAKPYVGRIPVDTREGLSKGDPDNDTLLDVWLESQFGLTDFDKFRVELGNSDSVYELVLESGKKFRGTLAVLCSLRLASVLMKRPNPLFFLSPATRDANLTDQVGLVFDPRSLLPTPSGKEHRQLMMAGDHVLLSIQHRFLFGSYLPELAGKAVIDGVSLSKAHARCHRSDTGNGAASGGSHSTATAPKEITRVAVVRYFLLGTSHVLKTVLSQSLRYGNTGHRVIALFVAPWSSRLVVGRRDYRKLRRLSRWGMV